MTAGILALLAGAVLADPLRSRLMVALCALGALCIGAALLLDLVGAGAVTV
jgi:hypothetical protein